MTWERFAADKAKMDAEVERLRAEVERLRRALNPNWMEAAEIEHIRVKELEAQIAAMRPIVEAVAEAAVGDEYGGGSWLMFAGYRAETIREQAQTFIAAHPAAEGESR